MYDFLIVRVRGVAESIFLKMTVWCCREKAKRDVGALVSPKSDLKIGNSVKREIIGDRSHSRV